MRYALGALAALALGAWLLRCRLAIRTEDDFWESSAGRDPRYAQGV